jgi:hypothetical protein
MLKMRQHNTGKEIERSVLIESRDEKAVRYVRKRLNDLWRELDGLVVIEKESASPPNPANSLSYRINLRAAKFDPDGVSRQSS